MSVEGRFRKGTRMDVCELLADGFGRIRDVVEEVVDGLDADQLSYRPDGRGNTIGWLVWHLTRVQDHHMAGAAGVEEAWVAAGWAEQFDLLGDQSATGYGQDPEEAAAMRFTSGARLLAYHHAVFERTSRFVEGLTAADLDRIVDQSFDPAVSLGTRLVSVIADDLQHAGQAAFVRGLLPTN